MIRKLLSAAIILYLAAAAWSCAAPGTGEAEGPAPADRTAVAEVTPALLERGRALYKANCAACHGEGGKGDGPAAGVMKPPPRDHTDAAYMNTLTDEEIGKIIVMGGAMQGKPLMPSHPQFRGDDLQALVAFTRSLSADQQQ